MQADIICFAEHNLAVDQHKTRYELTNTIKRHLPNSRTVSATSNITFPTAYKPGGCLQIITNTIHGRITTQGSDRLGRWTYVGLATKANSMIFVITIYKPCKNNPNSGPLTVFKQQWSMLRQENKDFPDPRRQFDSDLIDFIEELQEKSHRIIIVGDFNETRNRSKLFQTLHSMGLKDMIYSRHTNIPQIRSCNKGNNVIDYALCSTSLLASIHASMYEPFMLNTPSDHRGIVIDFNTKQLVGKQENITSPDRRGINSNNISQVDKFIRELQRYWDKYDIQQSIEYATSTEFDTPTLRTMVNKIDTDITTAMLRAERKVRKSERPPWSPALKQASLTVKYYKLLRQQHLSKTVLSTAIQHTLKQMDISPEQPNSPQDYQRLLRKAQKHLQKTRREAQMHRMQYLETLLQRYKLLEDNNMQHILRQIIRAEATKRCYKKLRWIMNPPKPGVTFVDRVSPDGQPETLYDRTTLENAILQRNRRHFNQCAGTPFTIGKLRQLGWAADSELANSILKGSAQIESISSDEIEQYLLNQCQQQTTEISDCITTTDLTQLFKKWKECTTTSPSGRHLGIYKAIFLHQQPTNKLKHIRNNIVSLINLLIQNGIGLNRWRKVTNMMIHKLEGSYNINKLRVIHLFEADYNGLIGILFNRRTLYHAERQGLLNNNQWGCRPHRQAEDALMLKELTYGMACTTKTSLATFDNDATGCFDRVPCTIAMLSSRRLGATKNMCKMQADTLRRIQHKLRTAFGTSTTFYESTSECEIHGQGQGSRAGPPTWVFVSSLLLDCMNNMAHGLAFSCPKRQLHHRRTNDAFVDDVTGYANDFFNELEHRPTYKDVLLRMQEDATLWSRLLHISGGKLALHKCLYYIAKWNWKHGKASLAPTTDFTTKICLTDGQQSTPIQHYDCDKAHRTLGQYKSPNGNQSAQLAHMQKKSNEWLAAIQEANLTHQEAKAAYEMIWFPSLSYGLGTTNLSYQELNQLQKPIINRILPALGYNRHLPRAVVFGSSKYGGLGMKHLYIDQGTKHITNFIKYYRNGGSIGQLLKISLRWLHVIAGFTFCPLARPHPGYHHIEDKWYQTTIRFLYECDASIETTEEINILHRTDDSCLMEDFLLEAPTPAELKQLNSCRLFLRVYSLSDICSCSGTSITRQCWEGTKPTKSTQLWPIQEKPPPAYWTKWRKFLTRCYLADESFTRKKRPDLDLSTPLGPWKSAQHQQQTRPYYINPTSLTIYHSTNHITQVFKPYRNTRTQLKYKPTGQVLTRPNNLIPIDCSPSPTTHHITVDKHTLPSIPISTSTPINTFPDYVNTLAPWEQELIRMIHLHGSNTTFDTLLHTISGDIIIASDGSVNDNHGSFGWVIATSTNPTVATGSGTAFGYNPSSFRSEAYGFLAVLRLLYHLQLYYHLPLPHRTTTWYCDSESLIKRIYSNTHDTHNPNRYKLADNDVELAIVTTIPLVTTNLQPRHIRSHQHDHTPLHLLPLPYRLNRIADSLAGKAHNNINNNATHHVPLITIAGCHLRTKEGTITRSYTKHLHQAFTHQSTCKHICHRLKIDLRTMNQIAWQEFAIAFKSLPLGTRRIVRRWMFGYLPTQRRLVRYRQAHSPLCPLCNNFDETDIHFLTCGGSASWNDILLSPLELLCHKQQACNALTNQLISNTKRFLDNQPTDLAIQSSIGWSAIFTGLFDQQWITLQQTNSPSQTSSQLITKLIKLFLSAVATRWKDRNARLHKPEKKLQETRTRLQHKIRLLYSCKPDVLYQDKQIFNTPLHELLQQSTTSLKLFINQFQPIIKRSIRLQQVQTRRAHKDIATYFFRTSN